MVIIKDMIKTIYRKLTEVLSEHSPILVTKFLYFKNFHKYLDLKNPRTLNEKILWLKLNAYNNNPLVTMCADKYRVRDYVVQKNYGHILNDLYFVWDEPSQIDWEQLPNQFALKCNHGCGYNCFFNDKTTMDIADVEKKLNHLKAVSFHQDLHLTEDILSKAEEAAEAV